AVELAARYSKPLLATSDAHRLAVFGNHYSLVEVAGDPTIENVFASIRANRIRMVNPPLGWTEFCSLIKFIFVTHPWLLRQKQWKQLLSSRRPAAGKRATLEPEF